MSTNINFPQVPFLDATGAISLEWFMWLQNPQFASIIIGAPIGVISGGTGLTSGTSGGVLAFVGPTTMVSSGLLNLDEIVLGGGAGSAPKTVIGLGTGNTVLHGNAGGAPTWSAVDLVNDVSGTLLVGKGGTGLTSGATNGVLVFNAPLTMASTAALTAGQLLVGQSGAPEPKTVSGDATLANTGVLTISDNAVSNAKLAQMATLTLKGNDTGSTADPQDLTVSEVNVMLGSATSISNVGSSAEVLKSLTGNVLTARTIKAGTNVTVTQNADDVTIASTGGGGGATSVSNLGTGAEVLDAITLGVLTARTLIAGSGVTVTQNTNDITIAATGGGSGISIGLAIQLPNLGAFC